MPMICVITPYVFYECVVKDTSVHHKLHHDVSIKIEHLIQHMREG